MRIARVKAFRGPNRHTRRLCVTIEIARETSPQVLSRVIEVLEEAGVSAKGCTLGEVLSSAFSCVWEMHLHTKPSVRVERRERELVVVEVDYVRLAEQVMRELALVVEALCSGRAVDVHEVLRRVSRRFEREAPSVTTRALVREARLMGIPVLHLGGDIVQLGYAKRARKIMGAIIDEVSSVAMSIVSDKENLMRLLEDTAFPVPRSYIVRDFDEALRRAERLGFPVTVKPLRERRGA